MGLLLTSEKKARIRSGSHACLPGKDPEIKPTCPPSSENSNVTEDDTSAGVGKAVSGRKGSLRAWMSNVGMRMPIKCGLLLALAQ